MLKTTQKYYFMTSILSLLYSANTFPQPGGGLGLPGVPLDAGSFYSYCGSTYSTDKSVPTNLIGARNACHEDGRSIKHISPCPDNSCATDSHTVITQVEIKHGGGDGDNPSGESSQIVITRN